MPRSSNISKKAEYVRFLFAKEDALLHHVNEECMLLSPGMQISPEEGKFLCLIVTMIQAKSIVEIGTFLGYSTLWMAKGVKQGGMIHTIERNKAYYEKACAHFVSSSKNHLITPHLGEADDIFMKLEKLGPFDLVFIDANKNQTLKHILWAEKNLKSQGVIIVDNSLLSGSVCDEKLPLPRRAKAWKAMQDANAYLAQEEKFCSLLFEMHDGMTLAIKR